jgi:hypothetical protein
MTDRRFSRPALELIRRRRSVRCYTGERLDPASLERINRFLGSLPASPFGSEVRFGLAAALEGDADSLKGLGTYGVIRRPAGFLIAAVREKPLAMADFGYLVEHAVLHFADLGLGSCWLGGSFRQSRFAERIRCGAGERVPAVISFGRPTESPGLVDRVFRMAAKSDHRKPWEELFFNSGSGSPMQQERAGPYAGPLEAVRLGPSASNRQPWRAVIKDGPPALDFYMHRDPGYARRLAKGGIDDLQQVDMGIAFCHFELTARETGLAGRWTRDGSPAEPPVREWEYIATWSGGV